jgi:protoporphyrinogen oxidase
MDDSHRNFENFDDFIVQTFGKPIADLFMRPYNSKVWAYQPAKLDAGWIAERVSVPDPVRIVRNLATGKDDVGWGPNNEFRFPKKGGTGAIWNALADTLPKEKVLKGCKVLELDAETKTLNLANGQKQRYELLISTMPLDQLAAISHDDDWIKCVSGLVHSSVYVIGLGLKGKVTPQLRDKCWMYFPEDNCPFYRVTHFSLYSPENVDDIDTHWSLMCEVSHSTDKPVDETSIVEDTINGMVNSGLIDTPQQVCHTWMHRVEYGYPTPTLGRDRILDKILPALKEKNILSRGRFGAWKYEVGNMDHSFMQGFEAAEHIMHDSPEITVFNPGFVNAPNSVPDRKR